MRFFFLFAVAVIGLAGGLPTEGATAQADDPRRRLVAAGPARVDGVRDGATLMLSDGATLRLTGILPPRASDGPGAERIASQAKAYLEARALGKEILLFDDLAPRDRYGRRLAHAFIADGQWLQGALVSAGLARVQTFADNHAPADLLLARERAARAARLGLWALPLYQVGSAETIRDATTGFRLVEGRVATVATVRGTTYLNFGADWRTDFTVSLDAEARKAFKAARLDPKSLEGRKVRVRGWVIRRNGPMIRVTHPAEIEVLDE